MAAEGHPEKMVSDLGDRIKQRCVTGFFHVKKIGTHRHSSTLVDTKKWMWAQWGSAGGTFHQWHNHSSCETVQWNSGLPPRVQHGGSCSLLAKVNS